MPRPVAVWTVAIAAAGLTIIGVLLCVTHTNHGLIELVIAGIAGLGGFCLRAATSNGRKGA